MTPEKEAAQQAVEELVAHYQSKARAVGRAGIAIGAFAGVLVGSVPLSPLEWALPIPATFGFATVLAGLGIGVLFGYVIGETRARMYHRMAEQARLQLDLEARLSQSDARMSQLLTALTARAAAAKTQAAPAVAPAPPEPVAPPAPVAAPAPPLAPPPVAPPAVPAPVYQAPAPVEPLPAPQPPAEESESAPAYQQPAAAAPDPPASPAPYLTQVPPPAPLAAPQALPPLSPPVSGSGS